MANDLIEVESRIFTIRGQKVMIDRDLAELYGVETKRLNEAVKRNITRFPAEFMFKLRDCLQINFTIKISRCTDRANRIIPLSMEIIPMQIHSCQFFI